MNCCRCCRRVIFDVNEEPEEPVPAPEPDLLRVGIRIGNYIREIANQRNFSSVGSGPFQNLRAVSDAISAEREWKSPNIVLKDKNVVVVQILGNDNIVRETHGWQVGGQWVPKANIIAWRNLRPLE